MTAVPAYAGAALSVAKRDMLIFASYRTRVVSQLVTVVFTVSLFYYVSRLISVERFGSPDAYFAFVVVGIMLMRGVMDSFGNTIATLRQELVAGTFERMVVSPFGATAGAVSAAIFPFALGFATSAATLAFGVIAFGLELNWETVPLAVPASLLAGAAFLPFALAAAALVVLIKQAAGGIRLVLVAVSFASGFYFPVELLPSWIRWVSEVQPLGPAVDLMRDLLIGAEVEDPAWLNLVKLAGFAAVMLPLAYWMLRAAIEVGRRRATITEY